MKTISICVDEFIASLDHTQGPWNISINGLRDTLAITTDTPFALAKIELRYRSREINISNSKLISCAPTMLRTLCDTYLTLLVKFAYGQNETCNMIRISLDGTLSDLRNKISLATKYNVEEVQTIFEQYVTEIRDGE